MAAIAEVAVAAAVGGPAGMLTDDAVAAAVAATVEADEDTAVFSAAVYPSLCICG